jgi:hypothetical protein
MPETKPTETQVESITVEDIDNLLGTPGADAVMTAGEGQGETSKPSFFQTKQVDLDFLNENEPPAPTDEEAAIEAARVAALSEEEAEAEIKAAEKAKAEAEAKEAAANDTFDNILKEDLDEEGNPKKKPGRTPLDKAGMAQLAEALIKDKVILPFEGEEKELTDYTLDDYKELFQMNFANQKKQVQEETPKEFFQSLPPELQYAAKYAADGGQDMKGLFRALAASEETKALSIDTEQGQERAAKQFLEATNFGTPEEIQEQVDSWKDLDKLEAKAQQFKPKLDAMQDQIVQRQVKDQENKRAQREKHSQQYADSIYDTLATGKLGDLKMDSKTQNKLYQGLIQPNYKSASGAPTNLFGHLIEKHQFIEPNHGLIAEALWLLSDPEGYKAGISQTAKNESAAETARRLKIEETNKNAGGSGEDLGTGGGSKKTPGLRREPKNFFKR